MDQNGLDKLLSNYRALRQRVDDHVTKVTDTYAKTIVCKKGCDACCKFLNLFPVEAFAISLAFSRLDQKDREKILKGLENDENEQVCPLLKKNECILYPHRPVICRTHGFPILLEKEGEKLVDFCPENFKGVESLTSDAMLDLEQLNKVLTAVNAHFLKSIETDTPLPERISMSDAIRLLNPDIK